MFTYEPVSFEDSRSAKVGYLTARIPECACREAILNWFTEYTRPFLNVPKNLLGSVMIKVNGTVSEIEYLRSKFCVHIAAVKQDQILPKMEDTSPSEPSADVSVYGIVSDPKAANTVVLIKLVDHATEPPFRMEEQFTLTEGMIPNYHGVPVVTDVGKFFANYLLCVKPFKDLIPYINGQIKPGALDDKVAALILDGKAGRKEYNEYMKLGYWFYEDGTLCLQPWTKHSLTTSDEVLKLKKELFTKYKDQLADPVVASKIEQQLLDLDKKYIKGDESEAFYFSDADKGFNDWRKKMFIMFGVSPEFTKNAVGYSLADESLEEGWSAEHLDVAANEIRRGTYLRHRGTAQGGEQTKMLLRIFQNIKITEEDCKSKTGITITIDANRYKDWIGRYLVGSNAPLTEDDLKKLIGKEVKLRSPMHCKTEGGFCFKCCGEFFRKVDMRYIGMQGLSITSSFTKVAMKAMHSSSVDSKHIDSIDRFLIE